MRRARLTEGKEQEKAIVALEKAQVLTSVSLFSDGNQNNLTAWKIARDPFSQSAE